jgi:beta-lactamase class A
MVEVPVAAAVPVASAAAAPGPLDGVLANVKPDPTADYGLIIEDLSTGVRLAINEDRVFPSASVYKLPLAWYVLQQAEAGDVRLDDQLTILDEDAAEVEPDGGFAPGESPTLREAIEQMIGVSSNSAAHALLRTVGRREFNAGMDRLGLTQTRVPEVDDGVSEAVSSASDIAHLLRLLAQRQGLSSANVTLLRDALGQPQFPDALRETLPDEVLILDKTGNLDDASNVGALLSTARGTVLFVVLDEDVDPGDARSVIAQLGRAAYEAFLQ